MEVEEHVYAADFYSQNKVFICHFYRKNSVITKKANTLFVKITERCLQIFAVWDLTTGCNPGLAPLNNIFRNIKSSN